MWHVSSRSGVATLRTAIHLLLTYLLTYSGMVIHTQQKNVGATVPRFAPCVNILRAPMKKRPTVRFISSDVA